MVYAGLFVWSLLGAYIAVWFKPKIVIPFLGITAIILTIIPFEMIFFGSVILGLAHNPTYGNIFESSVGGFNLWLLELFIGFLFITMIIEFITKKGKLKITPMFVLFALFLLSTVAQTIRGYTLGYAVNELRGSLRNSLYPILIIPISFYFSAGGTVKRFIKVLFIGWIASIIIYFMIYFGIFFQSQQNFVGRLLWPPVHNLLCFFPILIVLLLSKDVKPKDMMSYVGILILSMMLIVMTQSRSIIGTISVEFLMIVPIIAYTRPRGKRLIFVFNSFLIMAAVVAIGVLLLKLAKGDEFVYLVKNMTDRFRGLIAWRRDMAIGSRRYQIYESLKILQGNWIIGRGVGFEWYSLFTYGKSRIDSLYFMIFGHQGMIGMVSFLAIYALWMQRSIALFMHLRIFGDRLIRAFIIAQPLFIINVLVSGIAQPGAYLLPPQEIMIVCCAMITEYLYREYRKSKTDKNGVVKPLVSVS